MNATTKLQTLFVRHIALPQDHGSWVFLLSPLLIGLFAAGAWSPASGLLIIAALAAFLMRQPMSVAIKVLSGRRPRRDLTPARFWVLLYGLVGLAALAGLIYLGFGYLLYLAIPGLGVFIWHLLLISRRAERRQIGVEVVGSGVLALAAPAALWVGQGNPNPQGWLLFALVWLQSAASIVYAYLRLDQRVLPALPELRVRLAMGRRALIYTTFNVCFVAALAFGERVSFWLILPYALQWLEVLWGALYQPAVGYKPTRIGVRQLIVSSLFTVLFIVTWNAT